MNKEKDNYYMIKDDETSEIICLVKSKLSKIEMDNLIQKYFDVNIDYDYEILSFLESNGCKDINYQIVMY